MTETMAVTPAASGVQELELDGLRHQAASSASIRCKTLSPDRLDLEV
jgi:hypothetical protein